jgi:hypothetical protein
MHATCGYSNAHKQEQPGDSQEAQCAHVSTLRPTAAWESFDDQHNGAKHSVTLHDSMLSTSSQLQLELATIFAVTTERKWQFALQDALREQPSLLDSSATHFAVTSVR